MEGCDLAGFNILKFDVPMLVEEFLRADVEFDYTRKKIIDSQKIFHLMEKRTLSAAYKFYCEKVMTNAHSAESDTEASMEVLMAQIARYEGQEVTDGLERKVGMIKNDMETLARLVGDDLVDLAGRMVRNEKGDVIFNFGKHKSKLVNKVFKEEPAYYDWMMNGDFPLDTKRKLTEQKLKSLQK
jgi:DNA polymerase-3 subunit epsilon